MVYTPMPTVMSGGHFLCYDTMHLTEFSLTFDLGLDQKGEQRLQGSNALHPGVLRKVYRMALALPDVSKTRCMCPLPQWRTDLTLKVVFLNTKYSIVGV